MSVREKLLSFTQPQLVEKHIKALDAVVHIKKLTMAEARKLHLASQKPDKQGEASARMLSQSICDAEGKTLLNAEEVDKLAGDIANELLQAVLEANGLGKPAGDEGNAE